MSKTQSFARTMTVILGLATMALICQGVWMVHVGTKHGRLIEKHSQAHTAWKVAAQNKDKSEMALAAEKADKLYKATWVALDDVWISPLTWKNRWGADYYYEANGEYENAD